MEEFVYFGGDVAKHTLDVAAISAQKTHQFTNDHESIAQANYCIGSLQPVGIILEVIGYLEMPIGCGAPG